MISQAMAPGAISLIGIGAQPASDPPHDVCWSSIVAYANTSLARRNKSGAEGSPI
jgi:hypothetical protein